MHAVTDEELRLKFEQNSEAGEMGVYDGQDVNVVTEGRRFDPVEGFPGCGVRNEILAGVAMMGFRRPTNVQKYSIPYILDAQDVIVTSQTGSGKTAAYMLPVLTEALRGRRDGETIVLVLVPTRELAQQVEGETRKFAVSTDLHVACIFGGAPMGRQLTELRRGRDIIVATPGRLIDIMNRGALRLTGVRFLVLDEADRMLDMGFEPQMYEILQRVPTERQTLLFSATFPNEVQELARRFMRPNLTRIEVGLEEAPSLVEQRFIRCREDEKLSVLLRVLSKEEQTIVFVERKAFVDTFEAYLDEEGLLVVGIHGDRTQEERDAAIRGFKKGKATVMVATDVAARGIDIPSVAHVINLDLPGDVDSYIHRIGRTARAGRRGKATSLWCDQNYSIMEQLYRHFQQSHQPMPAGMEEFRTRRPPASGRRTPLQRDRSYDFAGRY